MKFIIKLTILAAALAAAVYFFKPGEKPLLSINDQKGHFSITIRNKEKEEFEKYLRKLKGLIYKEATIHNPEGNLLPDEIDDRVMGEIKERVN